MFLLCFKYFCFSILIQKSTTSFVPFFEVISFHYSLSFLPWVFTSPINTNRESQVDLSYIPLLKTTPVLVPRGFHNKLPQTRWQKPPEIYSFKVLKATTPNSSCWQGCTPSEGSIEASFRPLSASDGSGVSWLVAAPLYPLPPSLHGIFPFVSLSLLLFCLLLHPVIGCRDFPKPRILILRSLT